MVKNHQNILFCQNSARSSRCIFYRMPFNKMDRMETFKLNCAQNRLLASDFENFCQKYGQFKRFLYSVFCIHLTNVCKCFQVNLAISHIPSTPQICEQRTFSKKTAPSVGSRSKLPYVTTARAHTLSRNIHTQTWPYSFCPLSFFSILLSKQIFDSHKRRFCKLDVCFEATIIINHRKILFKMWFEPLGMWPSTLQLKEECLGNLMQSSNHRLRRGFQVDRKEKVAIREHLQHSQIAPAGDRSPFPFHHHGGELYYRDVP